MTKKSANQLSRKRKLALSRETIAVLAFEQLSHVVGGESGESGCIHCKTTPTTSVTTSPHE